MLYRNSVPRLGTRPCRISLDQLVQSVTLKIALHILFHIDSLSLDEDAVKKTASGINDLWHLSKNPRDQGMLAVQRATLHSALMKIFPDWTTSSSTRDNPLNFILPAYETLWRVVLFCFIEVSFRECHAVAADKWRETLKRSISKSPEKTLEIVKPKTMEQAISVQDIVNEALRLYTPTRRVHRKYHLKGSRPEILAADLEKLHRDAGLWGEEPYRFRPSRWLSLSEEARKSFMPFGNKPFLCPAQKDFGPKLIAISVASLCYHVGPHEWGLEYSKDGRRNQTLKDDQVLDTDRKAYGSWEIYRRIQST